MTINVTTKHIAQGKPGSARSCPIALAFEAAGSDVSVGADFVSFFIGRTHLGDAPLPASAQHFQRLFDGDRPVEPFAFEMPGIVPMTEVGSPKSDSPQNIFGSEFQSTPVTTA